MSKVPSGSLCNAEMIEEHLRPLLKHQPSNIIHLTDECRGGFHQGGTGCWAL